MYKSPLISAIVTTFNRAEYLPRVLEALAAQTLGPEQFEVVIVDDGSVDDTRAIIHGFSGLSQLRYSFQNNSGLAAAKNHGVFLARAPIILFLDDDDIADPRLLEEHLNAHRAYPGSHHAVLGYTDLAPEIADDSLMDFVTGAGGYLFCYSPLKEGDELGYEHFWGGRTSCKRDFLLVNGIFDPTFRFGCEDIELGYRLADYGLTVVYHPKARSHMIRRLSLDSFLRRSRLQGESQYVFSQKHLVPEVLEYTKVVGAERQWRQLEPIAEALYRSAKALDSFARKVQHEKLHLAPFVEFTLHPAYHRAISTANQEGIVNKIRASRRASTIWT